MSWDRMIKRSQRREAMTRIGRETRTIQQRGNDELAELVTRVKRPVSRERLFHDGMGVFFNEPLR